MNDFDVEELRLTEDAVTALQDRDVELSSVKASPYKSKQLYLASIHIDDSIATARKLGANPLIMFLLVNTVHVMSPASEWVKIPPRMLTGVKLTKSRECEAVKSLISAGLIEKRSKAGCKNMYKLIVNEVTK